MEKAIQLPMTSNQFFRDLTSGLALSQPRTELCRLLLDRLRELTAVERVDLHVKEAGRGDSFQLSSDPALDLPISSTVDRPFLELAEEARAAVRTHRSFSLPFGSEFLVSIAGAPHVCGVFTFHVTSQAQWAELELLVKPESLWMISEIMLTLLGAFGRHERLGEYAHNVKHYVMVAEELLRSALQADSDEIRHRALQKLDTNLKRVLLETTTVLVADKSDSGTLVFSPLPIRLTEIVQEVLSDSAILFEAAQVAVEVDLPPEVGESNIDPALFPIVLQNLFSNAIKYSESATTVQVRVEEQSNAVRLSISNVSAPLAPADLQSLFERYYRGANALHKPGSGLGLYLVRRIVDLHGGHVFATQSGHLITLTLQLPKL